MSTDPWYYSKNGQQYGPVDLEAMRQLCACGAVGTQDLVWTAGMPQWQPAGSLTQLNSDPGAPAAGPYVPLATLNYRTPQANPYAGFWRRFAALFIDGMILAVPLNCLMFAMGWYSYNPNPSFYSATPVGLPGAISPAQSAILTQIWLFEGITLVVSWIYFAGMECSQYQATPGKLALRIRVTDMTGERISFARASGRFFSKIISYIILCIGFMMAGWTERKQALHDLIAGTLVIRRERS